MGRKRFPLNQFDTTACPFVEEGTGSQHPSSFSLPSSFYNIMVFLFISILSFLINLSAFLLYNLRPHHSPVSMNSLPGWCSFAGRFYRLTKEQHAGFLNCWYLLGLFPPGFFIPAVIPSYTFFFLLKPEVFDSVSSLEFRDSFSAKLSRIWQIASRDSVTIFLFLEKSILPIRLALLPCTHFEKQKKLPDPKSERT